ncbi:prepilin-type N-terminal cleavage/methylation domain-containing protein [Heliophilum fasciatum]|uniref:Prepilin-type N-terminal cleavage/methylation domain-containing protein n=1 Tax=Heliophilum fasciatum TaxID=35700 RepID=A0A4R2RSB6_9FIRM|nr:prepilin-type N-terminal cleavage/methylation domain-containing protein [Heliophilum fasciatum]MCW2277315.1 prepilin-type N-terminal cleavage/methylation domain-containing protein [Heliophilum fasciatum]TCP67152.1 prepilin-type N-terminal cleavage/methylation domain-containing protein [Heliophilum fasciatum]
MVRYTGKSADGRNGFTLIEVVLVVLLVSTVLALAWPLVTNSQVAWRGQTHQYEVVYGARWVLHWLAADLRGAKQVDLTVPGQLSCLSLVTYPLDANGKPVAPAWVSVAYRLGTDGVVRRRVGADEKPLASGIDKLAFRTVGQGDGGELLVEIAVKGNEAGRKRYPSVELITRVMTRGI